MYNFEEIENKWQNKWESEKCFEAKDFDPKPKFYRLIEFSGPSGRGLHMGNVLAFTGLEVISRKRRKEGYNVLFPYGFDSFGLPTENQAILENIHPKIVTERNIKYFTEQVKRYGYSFDWSRVISTHEEDYYKWTQWIFIQLFKNNLAYKTKTYVNFCPDCNVVLANEECQGGICERCKSKVVQKEKEVWFLKITAYADRLLEGLKDIDFTEEMKILETNWIGKSEGANINFTIKETNERLEIFTTRPDTVYGVTFMVIAPEHPIIDKNKSIITNFDEIEKYRKETLSKTEFERTQINKDKSGVKIDGFTLVNPVNNKEIPIFISDYVMMNYGTGAIMSVPAHDDRDCEFAKRFNLEIIKVISEDGIMVNSDILNGISNKQEAIDTIISYMEERNIAKKACQYKMKDWPFNRQRYWGEPIPIIYCPKCGMVTVPEDKLPLRLPELEQYRPGKDGNSPLADVENFINCKCPKCGETAKRETDTMPQWAGSSWYYLRYIDPHNNNEFASMDKMKYWGQVDIYNGPLEHITRHVIYSRFWHEFLYDIGLVPTKEPYAKRTKNGMLLGADGSKMSKSKNNGVDPMSIIDKYGADVLRTYILSIGEYSENIIWSDKNIVGITRFLNKLYGLKDKIVKSDSYSTDLENLINRTIKKVSENYENMKFNTAISSIITLVNECNKKEFITSKDLKIIADLLYPVAPHICAEIWEQIGEKDNIVFSNWLKYDIEKAKEITKEIIIQVNGKVRGKINYNDSMNDKTIESLALSDKNIQPHIKNQDIKKVIIVKNKLVNIVL